MIKSTLGDFSASASQKPKERQKKKESNKPLGTSVTRAGRFKAQIGWERKHLGTYRTVEEAAVAYNVEALARYGANAQITPTKVPKVHSFVARVGGDITSRCGKVKGTPADLRRNWRMRVQPEITCERCLANGAK